MGNKKVGKFSMAGLIALGVVVVSLVVVIVGYFVAWMSTKVTAMGQTGDAITAKLSEIADSYKKGGDVAKETMKGFGAMNAFAILTLIMMIVSAIVYVVASLLDMKVVKLVAAVVGVLTAVCAIVLLITSFSFASNMSVDAGALGSSKVSPAAGPWLMTIFGVIGGGATAVGALKN